MGDSTFPIRYGVLECLERINITSAGTPVFYDIKTYIACKCYILSELKKYKKDGSIEESYEIVPTYKKVGDEFRRVMPIFSGDECTNKVSIKHVFNDLSLASNEADELNKKAFRDFATSVPYDGDYGIKVKTGKNNHDILLGRYKDYEHELEENTKEYNEFVKKLSF